MPKKNPWGTKKIVQLDQLSPAQRRLVLALIQAKEVARTESEQVDD